MPSHEAALISEARRVARLQRKLTALRRQVKEVQGELRLAKKNLKVLASAASPDPFDQSPPMRVFGETSKE